MKLRMEKRVSPGELLSLLLLLGVSLVTLPPTVAAQESHTRELNEIMSGLRSRWQEMEGLSASFTHTFEWILAGETQVTRGRIHLEGRNRFRLEMEGRTMVSDGKTIWDYDSRKNQVLLHSVDPERGLATQEQLFLAYTEDVDVEWVKEEGRRNNRIVVVRLLRGEDFDPREVDVWIDVSRLLAVRAEYTDGAGNNHSYVLEDVQLEAQEEDLFSFTIPEGAVVVDMRPPGGSL